MVSYTFHAGRLKRGLAEEMQCREDGTIELSGKPGLHRIFLPVLDNYGRFSGFGRIHLEWELPTDSVCKVYALITRENTIWRHGQSLKLDAFFQDGRIWAEEKKEIMEKEGCLIGIQTRDMLLYGKEGRFLWIMIEVSAEPVGNISKICVYHPGDNFMQTFPQVYQEEGSFFHRYLSVFSTIYASVEERISSLDQILDPDQAPSELLPELCRWLGISRGPEFLKEEMLRKLLKEACWLNRNKGTKKVLKRLTEILTGQVPVVVERNMADKYIRQEERSLYDRLYGNSVWDVTVLIQGKVEETLKMQAEFLLEQFKPVRSRLHLVFLENAGILDSCCYMDQNAQICSLPPGILDGAGRMDHSLLIE